MIYQSGPETQIRLRKGEIEKLGIATDGSVLSGRVGVVDAFGTSHRQARGIPQRCESSELERLRGPAGGDRRR